MSDRYGEAVAATRPALQGYSRVLTGYSTGTLGQALAAMPTLRVLELAENGMGDEVRLFRVPVPFSH